MDYMSAHVYNEQHHLHAQAWQSATGAKLAACRKLMAAFHHSQDFSSPSLPPPDYDPPPPSPPLDADPLVSFPKHPNSIEHRLPYTPPAVRLDAEPALPSSCPDDVVFYVGKRRQPFHLNAQTLISGSSYFRHLLQHSLSPAATPCLANPGCNGQFHRPPIIIDCEESIFESLLLLMRYGTLEALPPMSAAEIFRLKKEAEFYGIHYTEPPSKCSAAESGDDCSDMSSVRSQSSGPTDSPKSTMNMIYPVADKGVGKHMLTHDGIHLSCHTPQRLTELPEFPLDLANPARLLLMSCLDQEKASIYTCDCITSSIRQPAGVLTQWALNFHHRHAFCTACGHPPNLSAKHFAEMFMAAVAHHFSTGKSESVNPDSAWRVSSDSACMLRFISSAGDGPDACRCSAGGARAGKEAPPTIWAANAFYSHAFCTRCGGVASGNVLLSLLLALRYRGSSKQTRTSFRMSS